MIKLKTAIGATGILGAGFAIGWYAKEKMVLHIINNMRNSGELSDEISKLIEEFWSSIEPVLKKAVDEEINRRLEET